MTKKGQKKTELRPKIKAETITVKGTITQDQRKIISNLIGYLGSNEQDVIGKILTLWLYNEGYLFAKRRIKKTK